MERGKPVSALPIPWESEMRQAIFLGTVAGILAAFIIGGVNLVREVDARNRQTSEDFRLACESTGGKAVWNFKYLECLK